jgi:hypothetical protein
MHGAIIHAGLTSGFSGAKVRALSFLVKTRLGLKRDAAQAALWHFGLNDREN